MKYRSHKGGLEESMNTAIEIDSINHLKEILQSEEDKLFKRKISEIIIYAKVVCDSRIGWNQSWVFVKYENDNNKYIQGLIDRTK